MSGKLLAQHGSFRGLPITLEGAGSSLSKSN